MHDRTKKVLIPWIPGEGISVAAAAKIAGCTTTTIREWAAKFSIGRCIGGEGDGGSGRKGTWSISRVALLMFLEGDRGALRLYVSGDRQSPQVTRYFERTGVALRPAGRNPKADVTAAHDGVAS